MPRSGRLTPEEAHGLLLRAGFEWIRSKGSHRIYRQGSKRIVIPFHSGRTLHPKIMERNAREVIIPQIEDYDLTKLEDIRRLLNLESRIMLDRETTEARRGTRDNDTINAWLSTTCR